MDNLKVLGPYFKKTVPRMLRFITSGHTRVNSAGWLEQLANDLVSCEGNVQRSKVSQVSHNSKQFANYVREIYNRHEGHTQTIMGVEKSIDQLLRRLSNEGESQNKIYTILRYDEDILKTILGHITFNRLHSDVSTAARIAGDRAFKDAYLSFFEKTSFSKIEDQAYEIETVHLTSVGTTTSHRFSTWIGGSFHGSVRNHYYKSEIYERSYTYYRDILGSFFDALNEAESKGQSAQRTAIERTAREYTLRHAPNVILDAIKTFFPEIDINPFLHAQEKPHFEEKTDDELNIWFYRTFVQNLRNTSPYNTINPAFGQVAGEFKSTKTGVPEKEEIDQLVKTIDELIEIKKSRVREFVGWEGHDYEQILNDLYDSVLNAISETLPLNEALNRLSQNHRKGQTQTQKYIAQRLLYLHAFELSMSKLSELKIEYRDSAYEFFKQHLGDAYKAKRKAFNFKYKLTQYFIGERVRPILTDITHGCLDLEATQKQSYKTG